MFDSQVYSYSYSYSVEVEEGIYHAIKMYLVMDAYIEQPLGI